MIGHKDDLIQECSAISVPSHQELTTRIAESTGCEKTISAYGWGGGAGGLSVPR